MVDIGGFKITMHCDQGEELHKIKLKVRMQFLFNSASKVALATGEGFKEERDQCKVLNVTHK